MFIKKANRYVFVRFLLDTLFLTHRQNGLRRYFTSIFEEAGDVPRKFSPSEHERPVLDFS